MRGLLLPAAGDAREESPAEEARKAEDDGGMSQIIFFFLSQFLSPPDFARSISIKTVLSIRNSDS